MSTLYWTGGGTATAQVQTYTFTVTWIIGETVTFTIGQRVFVYTLTSGTIATFLPLLAAALEALDAAVYPEIAEQTWTSTATTIVGTADTAGKPFTCTVSTNSAAGLINGAASTTGTATTASKGPYDLSTLGNYSGNALPVGGDTLYVDREGARLKYGLSSQSGVLLAIRRIIAQDVEIGLPLTNDDGTSYPEYRATNWAQTATSDYLSTASTFIRLDHGTGQTTYEQDSSGAGVGGTAGVLLRGTHAANVWNIFGGSAQCGNTTGNFVAATLRLDAGCDVMATISATLAIVNNYGGNFTAYCAITTALNHPGVTGSAKSMIEGLGAVASLQLQGGTVNYNSIGTLGGNTVLAGSAVLNLDGDNRAKTITNAISLFSSSARFVDSFIRTTGGYVLKYVNCVNNHVPAPNVQATYISL